jgi:hypothetical protein
VHGEPIKGRESPPCCVDSLRALGSAILGSSAVGKARPRRGERLLRLKK